MTTVETVAPAKVNLTLHVTGRRPDGYHELHSLVVFAGAADRLSLSASRHLSLEVTGPRASGIPMDRGNIVLRAAHALQSLAGTNDGAAIVLEKHLPHGGGIGGGSSDAAATIRGLSRLWSVALPRPAELLSLGADVPVCLAAPSPAIFRGVGEIVSAAPPIPRLHLLLVNPGLAVSTPEVFRHLALPMDHEGGPMDPLTEADAIAFLDWLTAQRNDLTEAACALCPEIRTVLAALEAQTGCELARMSGSGSTCWGLFLREDEARAAEDRLRAQHPEWWISGSPVGGSGRTGLTSGQARRATT